MPIDPIPYNKKKVKILEPASMKEFKITQEDLDHYLKVSN